MDFNTNKNISFGWYYNMHRGIVEYAVRNKQIPESIIEQIAKAATKPDLEEFFLVGQKHFYYPDDKIKSYLDYTGTHNAKYMYKEHLCKMKEAFKQGQKAKGFDEAGRALHYLQDMTQTNHIDSGSIIQKAKEAKMPHHKFEMDMFAQEDLLYSQSTPVNLVSCNYYALFDEVVNLSKQNDVAKTNNQAKWNEIGQNSINLALSATSKFFDFLSKHIN